MEGTNPTTPAAGEQNPPKPPTKLVDGKSGKSKAAKAPVAAAFKAPGIDKGDTVGFVAADGTTVEAEVTKVVDAKRGIIDIKFSHEDWGEHEITSVPYVEADKKKPDTWHEAD